MLWKSVSGTGMACALDRSMAIVGVPGPVKAMSSPTSISRTKKVMRSADDYEWEMQSMDDGCWMDWEYPDSMSEEDRTQVEEAWENDWYDGLEALGWSNDDTEYWVHGPLQLEDESGNIVQGEAE